MLPSLTFLKHQLEGILRNKFAQGHQTSGFWLGWNSFRQAMMLIWNSPIAWLTFQCGTTGPTMSRTIWRRYGGNATG